MAHELENVWNRFKVYSKNKKKTLNRKFENKSSKTEKNIKSEI